MQNVYRRSIRNKKLLRAECYCNYVLLYIMEIDVSILLIWILFSKYINDKTKIYTLIKYKIKH